MSSRLPAVAAVTRHRESARIGVIADTHGLLRPEALAALRGVDLILHAGDVGRPEVLTGLAALAPLVSVRGNVDRGDWARALPDQERLGWAGQQLLLLHDLAMAPADPNALGISVVIAGHSHRPRVERRGGVLYFNPGSAGPRRFRLPVTVGRLEITEGHWRCEILPLEV